MKSAGSPHRDRSAFTLSGVGAEPVVALAGAPGARGLGRLWWSAPALVVLGIVAARRRGWGRRSS